MKLFEKDIFEGLGVRFVPNECFVTQSRKNVLRGMHFQLKHPQAKLITVLSGRAYDVIVDLRPDSPNYKKWYAQELGDEDKGILFIPSGFAHGFLALEDDTRMLYLCEGVYDKVTDTGICYDDPDIAIVWPEVCKEKLIISERDQNLMSFQEYNRNPMEV